MEGIQLRADQIIRIGNYPAPNLDGYNSLHFHPMTSGHDTDTYKNWGLELTDICKRDGTSYYYFYNDNGTKINVYPNDLIEDWWLSRNINL